MSGAQRIYVAFFSFRLLPVPKKENSTLEKARFGKRRRQIRKTLLKTYDHVHLGYYTILYLSSLPDSAHATKIHVRKKTDSENTAARFGKRRRQIQKTPLKTYDHVYLGYYTLHNRFQILPVLKKRKIQR